MYAIRSYYAPNGPWTKLKEPVLRPTYTNEIYFDNNAVHDPCVVVYNSYNFV